MLLFTPITEHKPGIIAALLLESYAEILLSEQKHWLAEKDKWLQFDREVFENPETIGRCVFVSSLGNEVIGFGSYDPRGRPGHGVLGHNCIVPRFQRRGYGTRQVVEILKRLKRLPVMKAIVTTSEHPFFVPAQKMYLSCGFKENRRYTGATDPTYRIIEYVQSL